MNQVVCEECGNYFSSKSYLLKHKKDVHRPRKFHCSVCGFACPTNYKLQLHSTKHSDARNFVCDCTKAFKTKRDLVQHLKTHNKGPFNCSHCDQIFQTRTDFELHSKEFKLVSKKAPKIPQCKICDKIFSDSSALRRHEKSIHENSAQKFYCECGKVYSQKSDLARHQVRKHNGSSEVYKCSICLKSFNLKSDLISHLNNHNVNLDEKKFFCLKCGMIFPGRSLLEEHFLSDHPEEFIEDTNIPELSSDCNICLKKFPDATALNRHRQMVHFKAGVCYCDYCMRSFSRKSTLKNHFKSCSMKSKSNKQNSLLKYSNEAENMLGPAGFNNDLNNKVESLNCDLLNDILPETIQTENILTTSQPIKKPTEEKSAKQIPNLQKIFTFDKKADISCQNVSFFDQLVNEIDNIDNIICETPTIADLPIVRIENLSQSAFDNIFQRCDENLETEVKIIDLLNYFKTEDLRIPDSVSNDKNEAETIDSCSQNYEFYCDYCKVFLTDNQEFQRHMYYTHQNIKFFHCKVCDEKYFNAFNLKTHENSIRHQNNTLKKRPKKLSRNCDACGKSFLQKQSLELHMRTHMKHNLYQCELCPRGFKYITSLYIHQKTHDKKAFGLKCEYCNKYYATSRQQLENHVRSKHGKEKPFSCSFCCKQFATKQTCDIHVNKNHTHYYKCQNCSKSCGSARDLEVHLEEHSGLMFPCDFCDDVKFNSSQILKKHLHKIHKNEIDYKILFGENPIQQMLEGSNEI